MNKIIKADSYGYVLPQESGHTFMAPATKVIYIFRYENKAPIKFFESRIKKKRELVNFSKQIGAQLGYLKENLDDDQDLEIFTNSVECFKQANLEMVYEEAPVLSVDNAGCLIAEWRKYKSYDVVLMMFRYQNTISMTAIRDARLVKKISGIVSDVIDEFNRL
jgi:hypothetical protein